MLLYAKQGVHSLISAKIEIDVINNWDINGKGKKNSAV